MIDVVRAWAPPFNPSGVITEAAALLATYRVTRVHGDRYAGGFPPEAFRAHGVEYLASERDPSQLYLDLLPLVNARLVTLLDVPELLRELRGLERRRGASGRDRVDHRPGAHDDLANVVAGALTLAQRRVPALQLFGDPAPAAARPNPFDQPVGTHGWRGWR